MPQQSKMAKGATIMAALSTSAQAFIVGCGSRLMDQRIDPLVNPGTPASHVHTVMGANGMDFNLTDAEVLRATCSTCEIKEDLSIYWTPKLYYRNSTSGLFTAVPQQGDTVPTGSGRLSGQKSYYLLRRGRDNDDPLTAFPAGFRMIAGDPFKRNYTGDYDYAAKAISFACLGNTNGQQDTNGLPNYNCPDGIRAQVFFPQCWTGKEVAPPGFKSHVSYPNQKDPRGSDYNGGYCPPDFPVHLPSLFYEVFYDTNRFKDAWYDGKMPFVFAQGDPTGYGFHGDFVNGWNVTQLQKAVNLQDGCDSGAGDAADCKYFTTFTGDQQDQCKIPVQVNEDVYGPFSQLPGCNPVQPGPGYAVNYGKNCNRTGTIGPYKTYYKDLTTTLGWKYIGCTPDVGNDRTYNTPLAYNSTETIEMCIGYCKQRGYSIAGVEYGSQCFCGNSQRADRVPTQAQGNCNMPCAGDSTELCGGPNALSTYQLCSSASDCKNSVYQHV